MKQFLSLYQRDRKETALLEATLSTETCYKRSTVVSYPFHYFAVVLSPREKAEKRTLKYYCGPHTDMTCLLIGSQILSAVIRACQYVCEITNHVPTFLCYPSAVTTVHALYRYLYIKRSH